MWDTLPNEIVALIMQHYLTGLRKRLRYYEAFLDAQWAWETDNGNYGCYYSDHDSD